MSLNYISLQLKPLCIFIGVASQCIPDYIYKLCMNIHDMLIDSNRRYLCMNIHDMLIDSNRRYLCMNIHDMLIDSNRRWYICYSIFYTPWFEQVLLKKKQFWSNNFILKMKSEIRCEFNKRSPYIISTQH